MPGARPLLWTCQDKKGSENAIQQSHRLAVSATEQKVDKEQNHIKPAVTLLFIMTVSLYVNTLIGI